MRTAFFFEELEPRLLFSADLVGIDTEMPEQDYAEEPAVTADLESGAESEDAVVLEADEEGGDMSAEPEGEVETVDAGGGQSFSIAAEDDANAAPTIAAPDTEVSYNPGSPPAILAPEATVTDADSDSFFQGTLAVSISEGGSDGDNLSIVEGGDVSLLNDNIKVEQNLVGSFTGGSDGSALVISWSPQATPACAEAVLRQIAYSNDSADPAIGSRTVDFVLTDGDGGTSNTFQSIIIDGTGSPGGDTGGEESQPVDNIAPVLTQTEGPFDYAGGDQAIFIAPETTVVDVDSEDFKQGTLTVSFSAGGSGDDQLLIVEGGNVSLLGNNIKVEQKLVGSFAGGSDGSALVISWSPQATPDCAEAVLRQIAYSNGSAEPAVGSRTVDFVLTDGDGGTSNTVQSIIIVSDGTGAPGEDPGQGEGDGDDEGDGDGGEVPPPIDDPIDNPIVDPISDPIAEPADEQDETPEPVVSGSGAQKNQEGGQQQVEAGSDDSGTSPPPVPPAFDPVASPQQAEYDATDGSSTDFFPTLDEENLTAQEAGRIYFLAGNGSVSDGAAPSRDGSAAEGYTYSQPEQSTAIAVRGEEVGDVHHRETIPEAIKTTIGRLLSFIAPSDASAAPAIALSPVTALNSDSLSAHDTPASNEGVCREVEVMRQEMEEAFLQSNEEGRLMVYTTTGASLSLVAGIARYFFHSGSLLSGFLATVPLWKGFDPVAILGAPKINGKTAGAGSLSADGETIDQKAETMFASGGDA